MRSFGLPELIYVVEALRWTLALSAIGFIGGGLVGALIAMLRFADNRLINGIITLYTQFFQGILLLLLMLLCYYGISLMGIQLSPLQAAATALTINASAFLGVIWESALRAIPKTQWESGNLSPCGRCKPCVISLLRRRCDLRCRPRWVFWSSW